MNFVGNVGRDILGKELQENLSNEGINIDFISIDKNKRTGVATFIVSEGDNSIIVVPGANYNLTPSDDQHVKALLASGDIVIVQLEILSETVEEVLNICHEQNVPVQLNPAPASSCTKEMIDMATYITPNETECVELFGEYSDDLLKKFTNILIVTQGEAGEPTTMVQRLFKFMDIRQQLLIQRVLVILLMAHLALQ